MAFTMKSLSSILLLAIPVLANLALNIEKRQSPVSATEFVDVRCGLPSGYSFTSDPKLPDPFTFANGTKVKSRADWPCRRQEINDLFQKYELGTKPIPKAGAVTGSFSAGKLSVTVTEGGKSITFSATIKAPTGGTAPYPAIIGIGGVSIPIPAGVGSITFGNDEMAAQQNSASHGKGKFFDLYGSSMNTGAATGWAWGVSRLIDALESTAGHNIDPKRLGVSGCSRNGKGAFIVGALDQRIALTIPQESGSGGAACWRISDNEKAAGKNIQTAGEIIGENAWFGTPFNTYAKATSTLPLDHHMLAGLVYPRGLFVIENDIDWLGPVSTTARQEIGQLIYSANGATGNFGFSLVGGHSHCAFPSSQSTDLNAYITHFLINGGTGDIKQVQTSSAKATLSRYYSWAVPSLA
jgi:hypothetical protein